jgi:UDP-glucose 4-epimerase|tara:strand:+ start:4116 stop:5084 length:969 start_codon:yes stop_codon:yes gene_type:complete
MTTLVTGASGFVGRNLIQKLYAQRNVFGDIISVTRQNFVSPFVSKSYAIDLGFSQTDKPNFYDLKRVMKKHRPKTIFHLASKSTVKMEGDEIFEILQDNILSTQKVCEWSPKGAKVVLASSVIVYGDWIFEQGSSDFPGREARSCTEEDRTEPTSIYGMTKRASEGILRYHTSTGRIKGVSARMCATVGRGLTHGVIHDFIRKILNNPTLQALGSSPGSVKPYCHIDDLISALVLLGLSNKTGEYNIVPDDQISIEEVAKAVMTGLNNHKRIEWLGDSSNWQGDNKMISVSNKKIKDLGWKPKYNSKQTIIDIVSKLSENSI